MPLPGDAGTEPSAAQIVLADDDILLREGLASLLGRHGLEVVGHSSGPSEGSSKVGRS
jgi:DNA-binding NarL/FixJ family response regulator